MGPRDVRGVCRVPTWDGHAEGRGKEEEEEEEEEGGGSGRRRRRRRAALSLQNEDPTPKDC